MTQFRSIFPIFGAKIFPENPPLSRKSSYGFLSLCQNSEKKLQINSNRRKFQIAIGGKGGRTARPYFIGPFRLPPRVQLYQFHYCRIYLADFSEGRLFCPSSPSMSSPKRPILNRVNKGIINISRTYKQRYHPISRRNKQKIDSMLKYEKQMCTGVSFFF